MQIILNLLKQYFLNTKYFIHTRKVRTKLYKLKDVIRKNYNIIFGATEQGSILYGKEQKDLTDIVLKELNEDYPTNKKERK